MSLKWKKISRTRGKKKKKKQRHCNDTDGNSHTTVDENGFFILSNIFFFYLLPSDSSIFIHFVWQFVGYEPTGCREELSKSGYELPGCEISMGSNLLLQALNNYRKLYYSGLRVPSLFTVALSKISSMSKL